MVTPPKKSKKFGKLERGATASTTTDLISTTQRPKVMPVAVEPLSSNKTAILTCLLKLPQGNANSTPKGSSPFVLCSTYVNVNPNLVNYVNQNTMFVCDDEDGENGAGGAGNQANAKSVVI